MRIIDESLIPTGDAIYFKQGTWTHLQKAYKEALDAIVQSLIGNGYDNTKYYILHGCVATGTDPGARTISAGAIFYDGEIYLVPAASFTTTGADVPVGNITVTYNTTDYSVDPQTTPGGTPVSVHAIRTIVFTAGASGSGDVDFDDLLGYIQQDCSIDISSTITVHASLTASTKVVKKYSDGTISVNILATYSGTIAAGETILSGLPFPAAASVKPVIGLLTNVTPTYTYPTLHFVGSTIINPTSFSNTYTTVIICFDYREI